MAEIALRNLEQGLDELEQLERISLFEKHEIKAIVKHRKHFEYRLRRFVKSRADFVHYINYEISLYQLIQKRRQRTKITYKKSEIEHSITSRIDLLFKKAEYKFAGDLSLWFSHIEFCKLVNWKSQASLLYTRLVQLHPRKTEAWIACAKFQLEELGEIDIARKTLQRGLRFLTDEERMWKEYFQLELFYWEKLQKRQEILELHSEPARDAILEGEIVIIVFSNAIEQVPKASFAIEFVKILKTVEKTEKIQARIDVLIEERFKGSAEIWAYKAISSSTVKKCFEIFEEALQVCPEVDVVWEEYIKFVLNRAQRTSEPKYVEKALFLMNRCGNLLSRDLVLEQIRLTHDITLARNATTRFPHDLEAWSLRLLLECSQAKNFKSVLGIFEEAELLCTTKHDVRILWEIIIDFYRERDGFEKLLERGILKPGAVGVFVKEVLVDTTLTEGNPAKSLQLFNKLIALRPLSIQIYEKFLEHFSDQKSKVRRIFDEAVHEFGEENESLWVSYIHWEQQSGNPLNSGLLYQRALDTLEGSHVREFVTLYTSEMGLE